MLMPKNFDLVHVGKYRLILPSCTAIKHLTVKTLRVVNSPSRSIFSTGRNNKSNGVFQKSYNPLTYDDF